MPRANRISCPGFIWHVTHRCHAKAFLLRFAKDRRRWRHWLFEARRRYDVCVLNYIATSNHIHLLFVDRGNDEISSAMQLVAGRTGQDYNRRKSRHGAFWEDRYHATAIQDDQHFVRCMTYIDLNMVRAGAVRHPAEWDISGYSEIQTPWKRKGIIDFAELCRLMGESTVAPLAGRLKQAAEDNIGLSRRESNWTEAVGIGDESFVLKLKRELGPRGMHRRLIRKSAQHILRDGVTDYFTEKPPKGSN